MWEEQAQLLEEILPVQIVMERAGWDGRNAQPSPPPEGLFSLEKKKRLPLFFFLCVFLEDPGTAFLLFTSPFQFTIN